MAFTRAAVRFRGSFGGKFIQLTSRLRLMPLDRAHQERDQESDQDPSSKPLTSRVKQSLASSLGWSPWMIYNPEPTSQCNGAAQNVRFSNDLAAGMVTLARTGAFVVHRIATRPKCGNHCGDAAIRKPLLEIITRDVSRT